MKTKMNKAEKFVKRLFELGITRNMVREAIFEKLGTWNFPPEYKDALATQDPNFDANNAYALEGTYYGFHSTEAEAEEAVFGNKSTQHEDCVFCQENPCVCETIELPKLPEPGTNKYERMIDFIRADYSKMIKSVRDRMEAKGKDFDEEFKKWKEAKDHV